MNRLIAMGFIEKNRAIKVLEIKKTEELIKITPWLNEAIKANEYYLVVVNSIKSTNDYLLALDYLKTQKDTYNRDVEEIKNEMLIRHIINSTKSQQNL